MRFPGAIIRSRFLGAALGVALAALLALPARAQNPDQQTKAARVASLMRSTIWPKGKLKGPTPLIVGVCGEESMVDTLREVLGSRKVNGREVVVRRCATVQEIPVCHVLYICRSEQERMKEYLRKASGESILTIGDGDGFLDRGGVVQLLSGAGPVQFTFDISNLKRADLQIDPETLMLANPPGRR